MDIDCVPLNPVENMPESLRRQKVLYDYRHSQLQEVSGAFMLPSNEQWQNMGCHSRVPQFSPSVKSHKAISSMREGDDAYGRIGKALDPRVKVECATNGHMSSITMSSNRVQGRSAPQNSIGYCSSEPQLWGEASSTKPATHSAASDRWVPLDLITSCVATLLVLQSCTERQYPPAKVAQILDNAVTNLHPCCSQNLSIYREIEMCMGRIKTQILALVPT